MSVPFDEVGVTAELLQKYAPQIKRWGKITFHKRAGYLICHGGERRRILHSEIPVGKAAEFAAVLKYIAANRPIKQKKVIAPTAVQVSRTGYVYLISGGGYHKIGMTSRKTRRLYELRAILPFDVDLVHAVACRDMAASERYWHTRFAEQRIRGEWFQLNDTDVAEFCQWKEVVEA